MDEKKPKKERVEEIERMMAEPEFWQDKSLAQELIKEMNDLKDEISGEGKYDKGDAIITIFSGAGGDDSEDFSAMLYRMYERYALRTGWSLFVLHKNEKNRLL